MEKMLFEFFYLISPAGRLRKVFLNKKDPKSCFANIFLQTRQISPGAL